ncbi:Protein of unknown function [Gryllus bimaculatus]|nr:Protein of unknown function [Gryllus bimaculatus]
MRVLSVSSKEEVKMEDELDEEQIDESVFDHSSNEGE